MSDSSVDHSNNFDIYDDSDKKSSTIEDEEFNYIQVKVIVPSISELYTESYKINDKLLCSFKDKSIKLFTIDSINIDTLTIDVVDDLNIAYQLKIKTPYYKIAKTKNF